VWNDLALQGALVTILSHGISTGALFLLVGALQERTHTREIDRLGGLWTTVPRLSGAGLFFALASLGLPGLGDFVGEFLVLLGTYQQSKLLAALASVGVLFATLYALRFVQGAFHGPNTHQWRIPDLAPHEAVVIAWMVVSLLWLGLYPRPVLNTFQPAMARLERLASAK
jgi:NADH-quinone oxidoreductase subunit M